MNDESASNFLPRLLKQSSLYLVHSLVGRPFTPGAVVALPRDHVQLTPVFRTDDDAHFAHFVVLLFVGRSVGNFILMAQASDELRGCGGGLFSVAQVKRLPARRPGYTVHLFPGLQ